MKRQERAIQSLSKSCSDWSFICAARNWDVLYIVLSQSWSPYRNIFRGCLIRINYQRMKNVVFFNFLYYHMPKIQFNFFAGFVRYWYFSRCCHPFITLSKSTWPNVDSWLVIMGDDSSKNNNQIFCLIKISLFFLCHIKIINKQIKKDKNKKRKHTIRYRNWIIINIIPWHFRLFISTKAVYKNISLHESVCI